MAIKICKDCKSEVSTSAASCPKCGRVIKKNLGCASGCALIFLLLVGSVIILAVIRTLKMSDTPRSFTSNATASKNQNEPTQSTTLPSPRWIYASEKDSLSKGKIDEASIQSSNTFEFGFPYGGAQHANLILRSHPRYGRDIIVTIERGQFNCGVSSCSVIVRFDDGEPSKYEAVRPEDHSTTTLFLRGYDRFLARLKKAKTVRIGATFFHQGTETLHFDVEGLAWPIKAKGK
jgi:hypothetical protein